MRRRPFGKLLPSAHAVDREFSCHRSIEQAGLSGRESLCAVYRRCGDRATFYIMSMEEGRVFWDPALPSQTRMRGARSSPARSRRSPGCTPMIRKQSGSAISASRQLFCTASRSLDQAISRVRNQHIPEFEKLAEWLPENRAAAATDFDRARRLSPRQHDFPCQPNRGCRRCWTGNCRRSAIHGGFHLSVDAMDHARPRQRDLAALKPPEHGKRRRKSIAT